MTADLTGVRVVVVNNFPGPGLGGGEVLTLTLVRGLLAAGADVRAVVVPGSGFGAQVAAAGGGVVEVPMTLGEMFAAARVIADQAAGDGSAVILGTGYWTNLLTRQASRRARVPVINFVGVMPGASIADGGSRLGLTVRRLADRLTASRVDAYVAVASTVAQALIADGAPATRMHTIPNSIDIDALLGLATGPTPPLPPGRPLVVCAARLEVVKGVEYLVRAAADVPQAAFAITGTGPLDEQLRELSVTLGVDERVAFLGRVPEVAPVLAAADIVVLPSLSEGLPTVAVEAMALGKPVVATRVGGTPEAVEDGVTGLLVEPRDPAALAAAIMRLADDPVLARTLGEAGAARARERFSAAAMVDSYAALIAELVASPRR